MFVILISFIFILYVSESRTSDNKNVLNKEKLRSSVTHLKDILFAIESKIKQEKTELSQISYKLNHKHNPLAARMDTTVKQSSDISMPKDYNNINTMPTSLKTPALKFTFPTMFPSPPEDNSGHMTEMADKSVMTDFSVFSGTTNVTETTTTEESQFIKDIKKTMREDNHNYFTAFLTRFTELIAIKKPHDTMPVIKLLMVKLKEKVNEILFDEEVGKHLIDTMNMYIPLISQMAPENLQKQALASHFTLKNKKTVMTPEQNGMIEFYGHHFNRADGIKLFKALEAFYEYNNGRHTASEVCDMMLDAVINPYIRVKETRIKTTVSVEPVTASPVTQYRKAVHVPTTQYELPSWRRNFEQNVKRFISKRPKLLEKIRQHYGNIEKIKNNHFLSRKQKLDQNSYRKTGTGQLDERKQSRKKAHISSEEVYNHPKYFHDNVQNHMLDKIREASSYSDEERHLRNNLYDALRHGNKTFVSFRKLGGDIIDKQTFRDLSSAPDEEWILKNNIYKVFEQNEDQFP